MTSSVLIILSVVVSALLLVVLPLNYRAFVAFRSTPGVMRIEPIVRWGRALWGGSILAVFSGPAMPFLCVVIVLLSQVARLRYRIGFQKAGQAVLPLVAAAINAAVMGLGALAVTAYFWMR